MAMDTVEFSLLYPRIFSLVGTSSLVVSDPQVLLAACRQVSPLNRVGPAELRKQARMKRTAEPGLPAHPALSGCPPSWLSSTCVLELARPQVRLMPNQAYIAACQPIRHRRQLYIHV